MPDDRPSRQAFTLIELLVVISIIALLIAILLPTLRGAGDAARSVQGLSHQRQILVGIHSYADEFKQHFPYGEYDFTSEFGNSNWASEIDNYIMSDNRTFALNEVFRDPNATHQDFFLHYIAHQRLMPDVDPTDLATYKTGNIDLVQRPSEVFAIADAPQRNNPGAGNHGEVRFRAFDLRGPEGTIFRWYDQINNPDRLIWVEGDDDSGGPSGHIRYRQQGGNAANVGFVDGHVEAVPRGTLRHRNINVDRQY